MAAVTLLGKGKICSRVFLGRNFIRVQCISTSEKKSDTTTVSVDTATKSRLPKRKTWVSYGWSRENEDHDRFLLHAYFFVGLSLCMVGGGFCWAYRPDYRLTDWAHREAFLELRRREALGLPLIDPNYIPPEKIILPSDEELGDTEIIV